MNYDQQRRMAERASSLDPVNEIAAMRDILNGIRSGVNKIKVVETPSTFVDVPLDAMGSDLTYLEIIPFLLLPGREMAKIEVFFEVFDNHPSLVCPEVAFFIDCYESEFRWVSDRQVFQGSTQAVSRLPIDQEGGHIYRARIDVSNLPGGRHELQLCLNAGEAVRRCEIPWREYVFNYMPKLLGAK